MHTEATPGSHGLTAGDVVTFEGIRRWPWLVRAAAWLSRVELPKRDWPRQQFVVGWSAVSEDDPEWGE